MPDTQIIALLTILIALAAVIIAIRVGAQMFERGYRAGHYETFGQYPQVDPQTLKPPKITIKQPNKPDPRWTGDTN